MTEKIGWRPTTREYDPNDPRPIDLFHPPRNTPPEVIKELWGGDLGKYPTKEGERIAIESERANDARNSREHPNCCGEVR